MRMTHSSATYSVSYVVSRVDKLQCFVTEHCPVCDQLHVQLFVCLLADAMLGICEWHDLPVHAFDVNDADQFPALCPSVDSVLLGPFHTGGEEGRSGELKSMRFGTRR